MKRENNSSTSVMKFARPFALRERLNPKGFSDELINIREAVLSDSSLDIGRAKVALLSMQIQLNQAALELEYMQLDKDQRLVWRIPVLDRSSEPRD
jgi:hypothetical protein